MSRVSRCLIWSVCLCVTAIFVSVLPAHAQTPTPAIQIHLYQDPLDDSIQVIGGMCQRQGESPVDQPVVDSSATAYSASLNQTFAAASLSDSLKVVTEHNDTVDDYRVKLLLPTPAPGHTGPIYVCSCPYVYGQDYICEYAGINPTETVNMFLTDLNASESWWQVYGGQVFARYKVRSKVPADTCTMSGTCIPSLLVAPNGPDSVGFVTVGSTGSIETNREGSSSYIHQAGDRTTSSNGAGLGMLPQQVDYTYYYGELKTHMIDFTTIGELQSLITAQPDNTHELYFYDGINPFIIDQTSSSPVLSIPSTKQVSIFVPTNLEITNSNGTATPHITEVADGGFLGIFVAGNVLIDASVGYSDHTVDRATTQANLSMVLVSDGQIIVSSDGDSAVSDRVLIAEGSYVAWDKSQIGNGVVLRRNLDNAVDGKTLNSLYPAEVFRFRPSFTADYPTDLKITDQNWQEVAPRR